MSDWTKKFFGEDYARAYPRDDLTESQVKGAMELLGIARPPPLRVLDLACGYGRHTLSLHKQGFHAFGLDNAWNLLERAGRDTQSAGLGIAPPFTCADMRVLPYASEAFDAVVSLFTSFGYFDDEADDQAVLKEIARVLKPGGRFFLDILNKEWLMAHFDERFWEEGEGAKLLNEMVFDYERGRLNTKRTIIPDEGERSELYSSIRLYTLAEMTRMLRTAGLTHRKAYGDYAGKRYDMEGFRMIVVAEKG